MSGLERIDASTATVGEGLTVRRAVPTRRRRLIGAWCFLDHFGPADVSQGAGLRVGPHPHIGLQTLTWLMQGELLHRDSLGSLQPIRPGQLNLMTAGRGIAHSEESPAQRPGELHGLQFWIALPESARHGAPDFAHHARVPMVRRDGMTITLLAGEWLGEASPAQVFTPLMGAAIVAPAGAATRLPVQAGFEYGAIVTHGEAEIGGERLAPGTLLYLGSEREALDIRSGAGETGLVLVGGAPFDEPVLMWWNFVARTKEELADACREWNQGAQRFGEVRGYAGARLTAPLPPWATGPGAEVVHYP